MVYIPFHFKGRMKVVGISEMQVATQRDEILVTYSLGSCVALVLHDKIADIGGMAHCMLPFSRIDPGRASKNPFMFVDTGAPALLQAVFNLGATRSNLTAKMVGAARMFTGGDAFGIGDRNVMVMRKILWKNNIPISGEVVGGTASRSVYLDMGTGQTIVRVEGKKIEL